MRDGHFFGWMAIAIAAFAGFLFWASGKTNEERQACQERGGVYVIPRDSRALCIDKSVIIRT